MSSRKTDNFVWLLVGVGTYAKDAQDMLLALEFSGATRVYALAGKLASRQNILDALLDVCVDADGLGFFFSGHAAPCPTEGLILDLEGGGSIGCSTLHHALRELNCAQLLFILDCCHAGAGCEGGSTRGEVTSSSPGAGRGGRKTSYTLGKPEPLETNGLEGLSRAMEVLSGWQAQRNPKTHALCHKGPAIFRGAPHHEQWFSCHQDQKAIGFDPGLPINPTGHHSRLTSVLLKALQVSPAACPDAVERADLGSWKRQVGLKSTPSRARVCNVCREYVQAVCTDQYISMQAMHNYVAGHMAGMGFVSRRQGLSPERVALVSRPRIEGS